MNSGRSVELRARPEYSSGAYPDLAKQRFWEVTVFRMRPGTEESFAAMAKAYRRRERPRRVVVGVSRL